jgi:hypothetical protein
MTIMRLGLLLFLTLHLARYGLSKILLRQFTEPQANLLYTPLGFLEKDILFWSTIGSSQIYNWVSGGLELITAMLLLHPKTRSFALLMASGIMAHVLFLNISFNIDVKTFALSLLLIALFLSWRNWWQIIRGMRSGVIILTSARPSATWMTRIKPLIILLIIVELLGRYMNSGAQVHLHSSILEESAYRIQENHASYQRIFFHDQGYVILQDHGGRMHSQRITGMVNDTIIYLQSGDMLTLQPAHPDLRIQAKLRNEEETWTILKIDLERLPLSKDDTNWMIKKHLSELK